MNAHDECGTMNAGTMSADVGYTGPMPSLLIVGAGPGLSSAIARAFHSQGYAVGLIARDAARLARIAAELGPGSPVAVAAADATQPEALQAACERLRAQLGDPDVAVFNAVRFAPLGPPSALTAAALLDAVAINAAPALTMAQCVAPAMRRRGRGTIFFSGGSGAVNPSPEYAALGASKAAMRNLALSLAKELSPEGVQVATVTIGGGIKPGTPFDPDTIAALYWKIHSLPRAEWRAEYPFPDPGA
jgi:NAD(P)-dependent dehydrogenase (short-subunit alcohol dehydrogenase family)